MAEACRGVCKMPTESTGAESPQASTDIQTDSSCANSPVKHTVSGQSGSAPTGGETLKLHAISTGGNRESKLDRHKSLSAGAVTAPLRFSAVDSEEHHHDSLPTTLYAFVIAVASLCGLAVTGVHYMVLYSGCPLGLNGCNEYHHMEHVGGFLCRWVSGVTNSIIPEGLVPVLAAALGGLLYCQVLTRLPERTAFQVRGGGAVQCLVAVATGERILLSDVLLRLVATGLYLSCGGPLGGEGPAIQVCTAISMAIGWAVGIRSPMTQSLLASLGFVCGFAASFNAPVAGILFAMEELEHVSPSLSKQVICCILVASVVATATMRACYGDTQVLTVEWTDPSGSTTRETGRAVFGEYMWMLVALPIGLICSFVGAMIVFGIRRLKTRLLRDDRCPYTLVYVVQAVLVALVGLAVFKATDLRGVWGIGVGSLQHALKHGGDLEAWEYIIFSAGKAVAMILAVSVRGPGDVLEPVLIIGGFTGGAIGRAICYFSELPANDVMTPCIIFGMVGMFSSAFRFPLTPIVIVLEITGVESYSIILPTALAGFVAQLVSNRLYRPVLDEIMHGDGIDLHSLMAEVQHEEMLRRAQQQGRLDEDMPGEVLATQVSADVEAEGSGSRFRPHGLNMEAIFHECFEPHSPIRSNSLGDIGVPSLVVFNNSGTLEDCNNDDMRPRSSMLSSSSSRPRSSMLSSSSSSKRALRTRTRTGSLESFKAGFPERQNSPRPLSEDGRIPITPEHNSGVSEDGQLPITPEHNSCVHEATQTVVALGGEDTDERLPPITTEHDSCANEAELMTITL